MQVDLEHEKRRLKESQEHVVSLKELDMDGALCELKCLMTELDALDLRLQIMIDR